MPALPLDAPLCPLCGQANRCAVQAAGSLAVPCWCQDLNFPQDLLDRVPAALKQRACICRNCAEAAQARPHTLQPSAPAGTD